MSVIVVTPPSDLPVSLADAKLHLGVDHDEHDSMIEGMIRAAIGRYDGPHKLLGRAIMPQTLELQLCSFPSGWISLPCPPLIEVTSVKYYDSVGTDITLSDTAYRKMYEASGFMQIAPVYNGVWPSARIDVGSVRIRYQAGYEAVPYDIQAAVKLIVGALYKDRENSVDKPLTDVPLSAQDLLSPYRVWSI